MKTWMAYIDSIGNTILGGTFTPRQDLPYLTVEARNELDALDKVAAVLEVSRANRRNRSIPMLGVGSIKVEEVV